MATGRKLHNIYFSYMTRNTAAGSALIIGSLSGLVTMGLHPTGQQVVATAASGAHNVLAVGVHALAIAALPMLIAGLLALTVLLGRERESLAYSAFILYSMGQRGSADSSGDEWASFRPR